MSTEGEKVGSTEGEMIGKYWRRGDVEAKHPVKNTPLIAMTVWQTTRNEQHPRGAGCESLISYPHPVSPPSHGSGCGVTGGPADGTGVNTSLVITE